MIQRDMQAGENLFGEPSAYQMNLVLRGGSFFAARRG